MGTNGVNGTHPRKEISRGGHKHSIRAARSHVKVPDDGYHVGPGNPPREHQFKPGQSGNPKGAKRKTPSIAADLKAILEGELNKKAKSSDGSRIMTMGEAGMEKLVIGFAEGDRFARRDLIMIAKAVGVDLAMGQGKVIESALAEALAANDQALLDDYVRRHVSQNMAARNANGAGGLPQDDSTGAGSSSSNGSVS